MSRAMWVRIAPFGAFMCFIGIEELLRGLRGGGFLSLSDAVLQLLYPVKVAVAALLLWYFRREYRELREERPFDPATAVGAVALGLAVFALWIGMDWDFATVGRPAGWNPEKLSPALRIPAVLARLAGAALVVPVMEEIFWRSFLVRYLVDSDFQKVRIGYFTTLSFAVSALLFGAEHNLIVAGIMAGVAYNLLLRRHGSIPLCILSHATTNFALGLYVLHFRQWQFW